MNALLSGKPIINKDKVSSIQFEVLMPLTLAAEQEATDNWVNVTLNAFDFNAVFHSNLNFPIL